MNELVDLIKKYIQKRIEQDSDDSGHHSAEDRNKVVSLENQIKESGYDPQAIYNIIENSSPDHANEVVEAILKVISKEVTWKKPLRVSDRGFISRCISTRETEQGLERQIDKPLIVAACGKVIKEEDIGVRCSICSEYDCREHAFLCNYCKRALCIVHTYFFTDERGVNVPYCAEHYKKVVEDQDTWVMNDKRVNRRIRKNGA
jgi:hypothetical protein